MSFGSIANVKTYKTRNKLKNNILFHKYYHKILTYIFRNTVLNLIGHKSKHYSEHRYQNSITKAIIRLFDEVNKNLKTLQKCFQVSYSSNSSSLNCLHSRSSKCHGQTYTFTVVPDS